MLWVYLITVTVFLISGARAQDADEISEIDEKQLKQYVEDRCVKYGNAEAFDNVDKAIEGYDACLRSQPHPEGEPGEPSNDQERFQMICHDYPQAAYTCVENVLDALESCLDPKEKYLSNFVLKTFNSSFASFCQGGASGLQEHIEAYKKATCIAHIPYAIQGLTAVCLPKMSLWKERSNPDYILTEADFCSDIHKGHECAITTLKKVCKEDIITELVRPRLQPFVNWCNEREAENIIDSAKQHLNL